MSFLLAENSHIITIQTDFKMDEIVYYAILEDMLGMLAILTRFVQDILIYYFYSES
ncbi:hypothetical protein LPO01_18790 [Ligilactobacillus pobuzihii]|nr:hypothetical protein LPO01_18790 [Ligilactobacillus pobuzihii]